MECIRNNKINKLAINNPNICIIKYEISTKNASSYYVYK